MVRNLLLQYKGDEGNSIVSIEELNTDKPDFVSNSYCGFFLQWFHSLLIKNDNILDFYNNLPEHNKKLFDNDDADIKLQDDRIKILCETWKQKFNNFLEKFWNNPIFLSLLDHSAPLFTAIEDSEDGFKFITNTLADCIFEKVFYGFDQIAEVPFNKYANNAPYKQTVFLMTKKGQLFLHLFYFYDNK